MKMQHLNNTMEAARKVFIKEVAEKLPESIDALAALRGGNLDRKTYERLYRFAHTLKGSGQMVKIRDIAEPAAEMNTALILIQDYGVEMGEGLIRFLTERMEEIKEATTRLREGKKVPPVVLPLDAEGKKILIVDDDPTVTGMVRERLEMEEYVVTVCHNTLEAENYIQTEKPDLILLDIVLPGESGIQFCHRIRSQEQEETIPIIFFTVKGELRDKLVGFATGADDYLAKPFEMEELVARIKTILARIELFQGISWMDDLTKVYNRRYLERRLQEEFAGAQRRSETFSLAMLDVDLFKSINDTYGHTVGDKVLKLLAMRISENLRVNDLIFRYGGDEFVVIFPATPFAAAHLAVERMRQAVVENPILLPDGTMIISSISAGLASFPENGENCTELLAAADAAMYKKKVSNRNRT